MTHRETLVENTLKGNIVQSYWQLANKKRQERQFVGQLASGNNYFYLQVEIYLETFRRQDKLKIPFSRKWATPPPVSVLTCADE